MMSILTKMLMMELTRNSQFKHKIITCCYKFKIKVEI